MAVLINTKKHCFGMLRVGYNIEAKTWEAVITETGKAVLRNLQHNDTAITEEVRRGYGVHQVTDG